MLLWKGRFSSSPHKVYLRRLLSCTWDWLTFSNGKQSSHPVGQGIKISAGGSRTGTYQLGNGKSPGSFFFGFDFKELVHSVNRSFILTKQVKLGREEVAFSSTALPSMLQLPRMNESLKTFVEKLKNRFQK